MDEKWVMAITTRCHIKLLTETKNEARYHVAHHKNYLDQVMFIVINGFIPKDNDLLGNGGRSVKVSCVPVGNYEAATKNSYKRVYNDDRSYGYPRIAENIERKKGEVYWKNKTLCSTRAVKRNNTLLSQLMRKRFFLKWKKLQEKKVVEVYMMCFFSSKRIVLVVTCQRNTLNSKMMNSINVIGCEETKALNRRYLMSMTIFISGN